MSRIRFWFSLWASQFVTFVFKLRGHYKDDATGYYARRLDPQFLTHVNKPKLNIFVTGTNGKTTITSVAAAMFRRDNKRLTCNDWGPNMLSTEAWVYMTGVDIFNKPKVDVALIEGDEGSSDESFPQIHPSHVILNNLGRDSMYRNANPSYIAAKLERGLAASPATKLIVNGDDPLCVGIAQDHERVFFGVKDLGKAEYPHIADDFAVCPVCGSIPEYEFRNYRHIGEFKCPSCGCSSPKRDYLVSEISEKHVTVRETDGSEFQYPLFSDKIHNIYNVAAIITLFRTIGYSPETIAILLEGCSLPESREIYASVGDIEVFNRAAKGQNPPAASTVFQGIASESGDKEIILMLDEVHDAASIETINYIWDTDYELLADASIKRIVVCGDRYLDHHLRLLIAGVPADRIVSFVGDDKVNDHLLVEGVDKIYLLHDVMNQTRFDNIFYGIVDYLKQIKQQERV